MFSEVSILHIVRDIRQDLKGFLKPGGFGLAIEAKNWTLLVEGLKEIFTIVVSDQLMEVDSQIVLFCVSQDGRGLWISCIFPRDVEECMSLDRLFTILVSW